MCVSFKSNWSYGVFGANKNMKYLLLALLLVSCKVPVPTPVLVDLPDLKVFPGEHVVSKDGETLTIQTIPPDKEVIEYHEEADLVKEKDVPSGAPVPYDPQKDKCHELEADGVTCSPNWEMKASLVPNDTHYKTQWGYKRIGSETAWDRANVTEVKVGVIDTGVAPHSDLVIKGGFNVINNSPNFNDDNIHGSHVSGTVCAISNNKFGVTGNAWSCDLYGIKFLNSQGSGSLFDAIKAIDWAIANNIKILNNSWGGGGFSPNLYAAIKRARDAGILFIVAAGNEGRNNDITPSYPASYDLDNVISVAAIGKDGRLANFSNYGKLSVDIAAPGVGILSTSNLRGYETLSGTSMAAPHVAGVAALLWSKNPDASYLKIIELLYRHAITNPYLKDKIAGSRELNADSFEGINGPYDPITECELENLKVCYVQCEKAHPKRPSLQFRCKRDCRYKYHCKYGTLE